MKHRLRAAGCFALKHLAVSLLIAGVCAGLVFGLWFPAPYSELASGRNIFALLIAVDLTIGPLLSFVVYDPKKPRRELWRDLGIIFTMQLGALGYGLHSVAQARPVFLAFEGDRYRIVAVPDIDVTALEKHPEASARIGWTGPKLVGVKLLANTDPEYPQSIQDAMQGNHPAFRPARWVGYETQHEQAIQSAKPLAELKLKHPSQSEVIDRAVLKSGMAATDLGYLPLAGEHKSDWSVIIGLRDGEPKFFLPLDAW